MSRVVLAKKAGISRDTLHRLFQGEATQRTIDAVAGVLGITAPKLMLHADPPPPETPVQLLRSAQHSIELAIATLDTERSSGAGTGRAGRRLVAETVRQPKGRGKAGEGEADAKPGRRKPRPS